MTQRPHLAAGKFDVAHVEELDFRNGSAIQFVQDLIGIRPLNLEPVHSADYRLASRVTRRALVTGGLYVISARDSLEFDPVGRGCASHINQLVLRQMEQNAVADDEPVVIAGCKVFRTINGELGEWVERQVRNHFESVGPLDVNVHHVMRLVKKHRALSPRTLLIAPIRILIGNHGIHIGPDLGIPEHVRRVTRALDQAF